MALYLSTTTVYGFDEATQTDTQEQAFTYGVNVEDFGQEYQVAYVETLTDSVELGGALRNIAALPFRSTLIKLAKELSPAAVETVQITIDNQLATAEVHPTGEVVVVGEIPIESHISLNGIRFLSSNALTPEPIPVETADSAGLRGFFPLQPTDFKNGAKEYASVNWETPGYEVAFDGRVHMYGLIDISACLDDAVLFTLPAEIAPKRNRGFDGMYSDTNQVRLDIMANGDVVLRKTGITSLAFVSLESVSFQPNPNERV